MGNQLQGLKISYRELLALSAGTLHAWNHYQIVNAVSSFRVVLTLERNVTLGRFNYSWDLHHRPGGNKIALVRLTGTCTRVCALNKGGLGAASPGKCYEI